MASGLIHIDPYVLHVYKQAGVRATLRTGQTSIATRDFYDTLDAKRWLLATASEYLVPLERLKVEVAGGSSFESPLETGESMR